MLVQRRLDEYDQFIRNKSKASKRTLDNEVPDSTLRSHFCNIRLTPKWEPNLLRERSKRKFKGERNINNEYLKDQNTEKQEDGKRISRSGRVTAYNGY